MYKTILADPPWTEFGGGKIKRGADRHYPLMKTKDIANLPVKNIVDNNAHLYLWVTNNKLKDGLFVMESWGFEYKTIITWAKDRFGLGYYFRGQTEHCLFGVKGKLRPKHKDFNQELYSGKRWSGTFQFEGTKTPTTLIREKKTKHSAKPSRMREIIETVSYPPYIELFAREKTHGWDVWGNEVESDIGL